MKKKFIFFIVFFWIFIFQNNIIYSAINNKIIAKVDDQIISSYELKNKIKIILFLTNQQLTQNNIDQTKRLAIRSLIDSKLKKREVFNYKIPVENNINVKNHLKNISANFNTNEEGLKKLLNDNEIDFELYLDEIKYEFAWQKLVYKLYKDKINLNEQEIIDELNRFILDQKNLEIFQLAEIEIFSINKSEDKKNIEEIQNQIRNIGFNNTAIKFSKSSSALNGGKIGWINSKSLSQSILPIVKNLKIDEISKPIFQTNSIIFLKLLDKKKEDINSININEVKNKIINSKRNELLSLYSNNYLSKIKNKAFIKFNEK